MEARDLLGRPDDADEVVPEEHVPRAVRLLGRSAEIMRHLTNQFTIIETMTPLNFLTFRDELIPSSGFQSWQFRELADRAGDSTVFYQATADHLPLYIELGLSLLKVGEEAYVDLPDFTFDGPRRADFRKASRRLEEADGSFEIVPPERIPDLLADLESISNAWLEKWSATEKGFSMGAFQRDYMLRNPVAIVRAARHLDPGRRRAAGSQAGWRGSRPAAR